MKLQFRTHIRSMGDNSKSYAVIIPKDYFEELPDGLPCFDKVTIDHEYGTIRLQKVRISKRPSTRYFPVKKDALDERIKANAKVDVIAVY